jgi:adenylate cyclase
MALFARKKQASDTAALGNVQPLSPWRRRALIAAIYITSVGLCTLTDPKEGARGSNTPIEGAELYAFKLRNNTQARRYEEVSKWLQQKIVLIPMTDYTFAKDEGNIPGPPPPRSYQAKVVRELTQVGAKGIVYDMVFEGKSDSPQGDDDFAAALRESKRSYIGCWNPDETQAQNKEGQPGQAATSDNIQRIQKPLPKFGAVARLVYLLAPQANDQNIIDRIQPIIEAAPGEYIPSLSLAGAMQAAGLQDAPIRKVFGGWRIGDFYLPVNADGTFNIRFWDDPADSEGIGFFPSIAYEEIYTGAAQNEVYQENLKNHIALIGDISKLGNDFRLTARGQMAGLEIQANAMATLMVAIEKGLFPLREAPPWLNFLIIALLAAPACWFATTLRPQWAFGAMLLTIATYSLVNLWLFTDHALYLHYVAPCVAVFLTTMGILAERSLSEERQKSWMRALLQRSVSPQVASYLEAHPEKLKPGGELVNATVLFADVRGFTALSSRYEAQFIVGILNEYLQAMTDVVFAYDGTLDKYMGDGIMVIFGAPQPYEDHACRAVCVAIDMQTAMDKLREGWEERGVPQLSIGIGIATGPMIAGNTGAIQRIEYTVLGDIVNLGSRIEGLNKELSTKLLIHESTYAFVKDEVEARGPLAEHVKGQEKDVIVYEILGWKK